MKKKEPNAKPVGRIAFRRMWDAYIEKLTPEQASDHARELLAFANKIEARFGGTEMTAKVASGEISAAEAIKRAKQKQYE
jgi:hypothetical protein